MRAQNVAVASAGAALTGLVFAWVLVLQIDADDYALIETVRPS